MLRYKNYGTIKDINIIADFRGLFTDFVGAIAAENWGKISDISVSGKMDGRVTRTDRFFDQVFGGVAGSNRGPFQAVLPIWILNWKCRQMIPGLEVLQVLTGASLITVIPQPLFR